MKRSIGPVVMMAHGPTGDCPIEGFASLWHPEAAEATTLDVFINQGRGELTTTFIDGRIRSEDTIAPGYDPVPPKDKEH